MKHSARCDFSSFFFILHKLLWMKNILEYYVVFFRRDDLTLKVFSVRVASQAQDVAGFLMTSKGMELFLTVAFISNKIILNK